MTDETLAKEPQDGMGDAAVNRQSVDNGADATAAEEKSGEPKRQSNRRFMRGQPAPKGVGRRRGVAVDWKLTTWRRLCRPVTDHPVQSTALGQCDGGAGSQSGIGGNKSSATQEQM